MVTRQQHIERRTGKVRRSNPNILPLYTTQPTNCQDDSCQKNYKLSKFCQSYDQNTVSPLFFLILYSAHAMSLTTFIDVARRWLVPWYSGRKSVFDRQTFPLLRSTCSCWLTTYVGKPSAVGQPTRSTQPFIVSG